MHKLNLASNAPHLEDFELYRRDRGHKDRKDSETPALGLGMAEIILTELANSTSLRVLTLTDDRRDVVLPRQAYDNADSLSWSCEMRQILSGCPHNSGHTSAKKFQTLICPYYIIQKPHQDHCIRTKSVLIDPAIYFMILSYDFMVNCSAHLQQEINLNGLAMCTSDSLWTVLPACSKLQQEAQKTFKLTRTLLTIIRKAIHDHDSPVPMPFHHLVATQNLQWLWSSS